MTEPSPRLRGFALLDPDARRAVAALGGSSIPAHRRSFSTNRELAKAAGKKGGQAGGARSAATVETGGTV